MLQILDASWMEHLRAMDHLRSSIGLQGYAQIDPKVEYKREGMQDLRRDVERHRRPRHRPDLPRRALRPRIPVVPRVLAGSSIGPRRSTSRPNRNWPPCRPPAGFVRLRTPPSPAASSPPKRRRNPSATLEKRWAGTTRARADREKSSKPAACGSSPRPIRFDYPPQAFAFPRTDATAAGSLSHPAMARSVEDAGRDDSISMPGKVFKARDGSGTPPGPDDEPAASDAAVAWGVDGTVPSLGRVRRDVEARQLLQDRDLAERTDRSGSGKDSPRCPSL